MCFYSKKIIINNYGVRFLWYAKLSIDRVRVISEPKASIPVYTVTQQFSHFAILLCFLLVLKITLAPKLHVAGSTMHR